MVTQHNGIGVRLLFVRWKHDLKPTKKRLTNRSWTLKCTIFDINIRKYIQSLFKFYYETILYFLECRNPSFGLATKAKGLQGCGPKGSPGVTSGTLGSVGKCEGVNPHTPKATPALGDGVLVDSRNFRDRFEGSNLNGLWRSLYQWKALEA
jgi:hypothetical protein